MVIERAREIFGSDVEPRPSRPSSLELVPSPPRADAEPAEPYEAESRRLVDDEGRPRPASPVLRLIEQTRAEREARHDRVAGLFPPPETTEWNVREIAYDRSAGARRRSRQPRRLPPITPGRAGQATGLNARWLRPVRDPSAQTAAAIAARSSRPEANR